MKKLMVLLALVFLYPGCSQRITQPDHATWEVVPCEYRFEGDDESILLVRAHISEFDSAKIITHTLCWTVLGDTLCNETTLCPREHEIHGGYTVFTTDRCLPINSVIRSVELLIKK